MNRTYLLLKISLYVLHHDDVLPIVVLLFSV